MWDGDVDGLRLSILDAHGSTPERLTWENGEGKTIGAHISEIVVELITTAEIQISGVLCTPRWVAHGAKGVRGSGRPINQYTVFKLAPRRSLSCEADRHLKLVRQISEVLRRGTLLRLEASSEVSHVGKQQ